MLSYETIFSRMRNRYNDPKELSLDENDLLEIYIERLHLVVGIPKIRHLFSSLTMDDEIQTLEFSLVNSVDETSDEDFVINLLSLGMTVEWLQPQVDSVLHTSVMVGDKGKKILDNHSHMIERLKSMKNELRKLIRDYGYLHNSYIEGGV